MSDPIQATTPTEERLQELLLRWQELRQAGATPTPEQLTGDDPELADELGRRIAALRAMNDLLGLGDDASTADPAATRPYAAGEGLDAGPTPIGLSIPGYEILELIERGGMGTIYRARQLKSDQIVALKVLHSGRHAGPEQRQRFLNEAMTVAQLKHPHIVQLFGLGEAHGQPYLVMELAAGGSLAHRLSQGPLPLREAAALTATLADAVGYAHGCGVVHRDLKPANVLLDDVSPQKARSALTPKITDFGLAKRLDVDSGQTPTVAILGTPSYMAPEQAEGKMKDVGPPADIYALGAILYELLTGRPPFRGETEVDTLRQVREREPMPPRRLQPNVPCDLETICLKCLQKDPLKRYASATALRDDLRRWLDGRPILARPTPLWESAWKWTRRKPAWAALLAVSVAAAATLLVVWIRFTGELKKERDAAVRERDDAQQQRERGEKLLYRCVDEIARTARDVDKIHESKTAEGDASAAFYTMAAIYAETADAYLRDDKLAADDRKRFVQAYDTAALELLRQAERYGYFNDRPDRIERMNKDAHLTRLRSQERFRAWSATLERR